MGKHKDKKSKKHKKEKKHKKKHYGNSDDSSGEEEEILWCDGSESKTNKDDKKKESSKKFVESSKKQEESVKKPETETVNRENVDDWLGFFEKTTSGNAKQGTVDRQKRKEDLSKADNKLRYARELNSYYKDEEKGQYIENPDEYYKKKDKSQAQEYSDSGSNSDSDSGGEDKDQSDKEEERKPLTPAEKNALNAKILKAEMLGDEDLVKELKSQLERSSGSRDSKNKDRKEVEVYQRKVTKQEKEASEDSLSVREMYYQMKSSTSSRAEVMGFISSASKFKRPDDEYDEVKSKKKKQKTEKEVYEKRRDVQDSKCRQCLEEIDRKLVLRFEPGLESCFVSISDKETFVPNVCQIRSRDHSMRCSLDGDEDCWREIRQAMRKIAAFFDKVHGQTVIFMETHFRNEKAFQNLSRKHFVIEAIPLKRKYEDDARIYFHKAIMECEEEWSTNKKLIKLEEKPVTSKIPKGLPYFWVSFGPNFNGFAHIIDDERRFPHNFGTEIISGLLDIDCSKWNKHTRHESNSSSGRFTSDWKQFLTSSK